MPAGAPKLIVDRGEEADDVLVEEGCGIAESWRMRPSKETSGRLAAHCALWAPQNGQQDRCRKTSSKMVGRTAKQRCKSSSWSKMGVQDQQRAARRRRKAGSKAAAQGGSKTAAQAWRRQRAARQQDGNTNLEAAARSKTGSQTAAIMEQLTARPEEKVVGQDAKSDMLRCPAICLWSERWSVLQAHALPQRQHSPC